MARRRRCPRRGYGAAVLSPGMSMFEHRRLGLLPAGVSARQRSATAFRPWPLEKGGRRTRTHRGSEPMNQLPHASICITIFVSNVVLWKTFDEDGSQRLVLAVVGCRIGVQEELLAASVIHDRTPQVLVGFRCLPPLQSHIKNQVQGQAGRRSRLRNQGKPIGLTGPYPG